uniref:Uncharacterized protein n=1 Tax=Moniliophthora roreri TaxID=221103 RepID=A0A0W0FVY4_MONRR
MCQCKFNPLCLQCQEDSHENHKIEKEDNQMEEDDGEPQEATVQADPMDIEELAPLPNPEPPKNPLWRTTTCTARLLSQYQDFDLADGFSCLEDYQLQPDKPIE